MTSGVTPAARSISSVASACRSRTMVTTVPAAPPRAVRPDRWTYVAASGGGSTWTTRSSESTSMPRAATSVATRTGTSPEAKPASAARRAVCPRSPWSASTRMPWPAKCPVRDVTRFRVLQNRTTRPSRAAIHAVTASAASLSGTRKTRCFIVSTETTASATSWRTGSRPSMSTSAASSRVAENSIRVAPAGVARTRPRTSGKNPSAASSSASSMTTADTSSSESRFCLRRSCARPGVTTATSTGAASVSFCRLMFSPPTKARTRRPAAAPRSPRTSAIWSASSRVGAMTSPRGRPGFDAAPAND